MPDLASDKPWTRLKNAGKKVPMAYMLKFSSAPEAIIHHSVGMRSTLHIEPRASGARWLSLAPRSGSGIISKAGIRNNAGTAANTIAARQPYACAIGPLKKKPSAPPTGTPSMNSPSTRERLVGGNRSPSQLVAVGAQAASPTPTPTREKSSIGEVGAG